MPTYEYLCDACGHQFDLFQSIQADPERKCPKCRKLKLRRLIGAGAAVVFKGSGFYQTDYRSEGYRKSAAKDSKPSDGGGSSSDSSSKTDSKSSAGPEKPAAKKSSNASKKGAE